MMTQPLLKLRDVAKSYGNFTAVKGIDLEIRSGEFIAIMGASGCGKTTTLRMMAGLEEPTRGEVWLQGRQINDLPVWARETPLVWQNLALFPHMSVRENIEFGLRMRKFDGAERRRRSNEWLERLGITAHAERNVTTLSGGQRQRVALARCLVLQPEILLLDEPLSALDSHMSIRMQAELKRLQRELGITFIYVTHSHSEAFSLADRVVIMNGGEIEQQGTPQDIFLRPRTRFVAQFVGGISLFTGKLIAGDNGKAMIDSSDGILEITDALDVSVGATLDLAVRAERINVTTQPGRGTNQVPCTLMSEEFAGAVVNLHLATAAGTEIVAQLRQRDLERLSAEPGQQVFASWSHHDGVLLGATDPQTRVQ